jgi:RNase adaptor protein for sRNA GlmZ degradation
MFIGSFGHKHLELKLRSTDVYFDIRDEFPKCDDKRSLFGIDKKIQKGYLKQKGVKKLYKKEIYEKVVRKIKKRKHHNFRVFIGDNNGALEAVILAEKLERDLTKKHKIIPFMDHITLTDSVTRST